MASLAFAIYAGLRDIVGSAWAAAGVAAIAALVALILALILARKIRPKPAKSAAQTLSARLIELARERPLLAAGAVTAAAAAAVTVAIKNPRVLTAILAAALAPKPGSRR